MTKNRFGAVFLMVGALASFGCGGDTTPQPDNGMTESDLGLPDGSVDDQGVLDEGVPDGGDVDEDMGPDLLSNGASCSSPLECDSGSCVDGVCCNVACSGTCVACTASLTGGTDGTCAPVTSETDPDDECAEDVCTFGTCDGAGACTVESSETVCRGSTGLCDIEELCDGTTGVCPSDGVASSTASVPACAPYMCPGVGTACRTTCASDTDCSFTNFCVLVGTNMCLPGRRIFVTSTVHTGNLGGLAGADAICQTRANAGGLTGTYRAWLSSGASAATNRIHHYGGVYFRIGVNGPMRVASNWADLANGLDNVAIATDEFGVSAGSSAYAWTGTNADGTVDTSTTRCSDWTSADGNQTGLRGWTSAGVSDWTSNGSAACSASLRLYCVETTPPG
jgi:hypothetical protein